MNNMAEQIKSVFEFAWLTTQQIAVTSDKEGTNIKGFGSGFFLQYKERLFFVTADHVAHPDDFEVGIRLGKDDYVWVFNNKNSTTELATMLTPIGGIYYFDKMDFNDELSFEILDMKDIAFAILPNSFKAPFLTHELKCDDEVIVAPGREKVIVKSECIAELSKEDYCLMEGCVHWDIKGVRFERCNAIYCDLRLNDVDSEGYYLLEPTIPVVYKDWAGLSGGPVYNDKCQLIGMAISVSEVKDIVRVVPMEKITNLMDMAIRYEEDIEGAMMS